MGGSRCLPGCCSLFRLVYSRRRGGGFAVSFGACFMRGFSVRFVVLLLGGCCGLALVNTMFVAWSPF